MQVTTTNCRRSGAGMLSVFVTLWFLCVSEALAVPSGLTSTIGDFVWNDLNRNGIQDAGEPGVGNVQVNLNYILSDSSIATLASALTNSSGLYSFEESFNANVVYFLEFILPDSTWYFSPSLQGADPAKDSDVINAAALAGTTSNIFIGMGQTDFTYDAGIYADSGPTPVPEPSTLGLFLFGLAGLAFARRNNLN